MTAFKKLIVISLLLFCLSNCSSKKSNTELKKDHSSSIPKFIDSGKTIDSLKLIYQAESIEYENWEDNDLNDSTLTVCFINSPTPPIGKPDTSNYNQLTNIARQINRTVALPEKYLSYYIIFINTDTTNGIITKSHTNGAKIPKKQL